MTLLLNLLDGGFRRVHDRSLKIVLATDNDILFRKPENFERSMAMFSIGEYILRSASVVEQAIGGITTRLWDDPYEWTLPEELFSGTKIAEHLAEVETSRQNGFRFLTTDDDLSKTIPAPRELLAIGEILINTLASASHYQGRSAALYELLSGRKSPVQP